MCSITQTDATSHNRAKNNAATAADGEARSARLQAWTQPVGRPTVGSDHIRVLKHRI